MVRARRLFVRVRREHAIDAMAAGVRPSSRRANAPLGQCRATPDAAAGAKPAGVCHRRGGEVVVNLAAGPNDDAALRLIWLAIMRAKTNWRTCYNWTHAMAVLRIHFGDRIPDNT